MIPIILVTLIIIFIFLVSKKKKLNEQKTTEINLEIKNINEKEMKDEISQNIPPKIEITITTTSSINNKFDDSIIDVTNQSEIIESNLKLIKYIDGVPHWAHHYVYSFSEIESATTEQKKFYSIFKSNFLNGIYFDLEGNTNYSFILLFDLLNDYDTHKNINKLESELKILGQCYPKTKSYCISFLIKKMELDGYSENISKLREEENINYQTYYSNYENDDWKLGNRYKSKLKLKDEEIKLLNKLWNPTNNFCSIDFCCKEIIKLFISIISKLKTIYESENTSIDNEFLFVADVIARKEFKFKKGSQNYKYSIESITNEFYTNIFKLCENAVREYYGHKRKLNIDTYFKIDEAKSEYESRIVSKILEVTKALPDLIVNISSPDEATEIELNSQTTSRWKIIFNEIKTNFNGNSNDFKEAILKLGDLNKKNPSIESIFFEASKFIAKYDNELSLTLYIHYLYQDLKSATFDNKQLTKTIQKSLFKNNEQLKMFEQIVSQLIKDKDLIKALNNIPSIYEVKRKKIILDNSSIKEVQKQHSGTVELLNEYLRDDFEDENNSIVSREINDEEIKIEITKKNDEKQKSIFIDELDFNQIHITILEMFSKNNFSITQKEIELFAKSKGVFKNQIIENINEICFEILDDNLIEEDDEYYTIIPEYFQKILVK